MADNREIFERLMSAGRIQVRRGQLFDTDPEAESRFDFDRIEGMLLGLAIGDALGNTTEGQLPGQRQREHGEIRDYLPNRYAHGRAVGLPSDDSQLAFWTLEQLVEDRRLDPNRLARLFADRAVFGQGHTFASFVLNHKSGALWHEAGVVDGAGNGALMRIAPVLLPHLAHPGSALWSDVALATMFTHNGSAAIASTIAFVAVLWDLLAMDRPPAASWWLDRFVAVMREVETDASYTPRGGDYRGRFSGTLSDFTTLAVPEAVERGLSVREACNAWYSGAYLLETVPSVIYVLMRHASDPEEAIIRAVNDTKDNDTIAAIVGAAVGALHGRRALPDRLVRDLLGRTREDDDGQVFALIERAREQFGPRPQAASVDA